MCSKNKNKVPDLELVNKQILELKKKIQLSEGQRKALFEICEAEKKQNAEEIVKLKKEIAQLNLALHENSSTAAKNRIKMQQLESIIGPLGDKKVEEVKHLLDLQIMDKSKQLNLVQYRVKQKQKYLTKLAKDYKQLLSKKIEKQAIVKMEAPLKKSIMNLQNKIHAIEVQLREADHIRSRYKEVKLNLIEDAARFESNIKQIEEEIKNQQVDINKLQEILQEAYKVRGVARNILMKEERNALASAASRDKQANNGRKLVLDRKQDLERLEKKIFQIHKPVARPETEVTDEGQNESSTPPPNELEVFTEVFEKLKIATGSTNIEEVLEKFESQKETTNRLSLLRKSGEIDKHHLEKQLERLTIEMETNRYTESKDIENDCRIIEEHEKQITEENERKGLLEEKIVVVKKSISSIVDILVLILLQIDSNAKNDVDHKEVIELLEKHLKEIMLKAEAPVENGEALELEMNEEKWLPPSYSGLILRTPVPQQGPTPVPTPGSGSDDEDDVPSRSFLKRQAQLVVDAKSRRKNMRIPLPKI